jgi:hypothetical protein
MALAFRAATEAGTGSAATSLAVNVPAGVVDGDHLVLFGVTADGDDGAFNALTGWTASVTSFETGGAAPSPPAMTVWTRIASSEPSSYTITPTAGSTGIVGMMIAFSGGDAATLLDVAATTATGDSTNANPPSNNSGSGTDAFAVIVAAFWDGEASVFTATPSGYTDPLTGEINGTGGGNGCEMAMAYRTTNVDPAAAEDPAVFSSATEQWGAVTVSLRPAASVSYEQEGFRFRKDDGSESAATWEAAQDTAISKGKSTNVRLRTTVVATGDPATAQVTLQYRKVGDAVTEWRDVPL